MEKKNKKRKWIVPLICSVVAVIAVIAIVVVLVVFVFDKKEEYRVIKIAEHQGDILLERDDKEIDLSEDNSFRGMNLKSEDAVTTQEDASVVLLVDSDKHIYADENTRFSIVATGDDEKGKIKINLESGTTLCELESKLPSGASFEVEAPNATIAVRGTTFGVYYNEEKNETKVEVLDGTVKVETPTDTWDIEAGNTVLIAGDEGIISQETEPNEFDNIVSIMDSIVAERTPDENAVEGHPILDDSTKREYIVVYSGAAMMFGNGEGVFIFETGNGASSKEMAMISQELSDNFNEIYGNINLSGNSVKITYKQIPGFAIDIIKKFCVDSEDYMKSITFDALGIGETQDGDESAGIVEGIMKYAFDFKVVESTPYDFYNGLGLIE